jgi:cytoplasmic iron level regulating protein YaaA (DUF328/UPF0246 family)
LRLLLPPSEAKRSGGRGRSLGGRELSGPLGAPRLQLLRAVASAASSDRAAAVAAFHLPPAVAADALAANARVLDSATMPAIRRYAGVLYDALGFEQLPPAGQRVAARSVLIFSGLFGVLSGHEAIPLYRVPAKASLPGLGITSTYWRPVLDEVVPSMLGTGLIVDLRSSDYAAMWRPASAVTQRLLSVRVLSSAPDGRHRVISYPSKHAKGALCAELIRRVADGQQIESARDVGEAWLACGGQHADTSIPGHIDLYTS